MPATPETGATETILAFDFGLRRIGVAVGQAVTASASAVGVVPNGERGPDWTRIDKLVAEWQPARLVVGLPLMPDGSPSAIGENVSRFCGELARFGLPVQQVDERYTSQEAGDALKRRRRAGLRGRIRKETVDAAAAVMIAERWLGGRA